MRLILVIILAAIYAGTKAQCLTDFNKLLPEPTIDFTQDFGRSISMYNDYLAIGIPNSDSLGRITGLVQIYQKVNGGWKKIASMVPSDPRDALQFGVSVKLSQDYLLVGAAGYRGKVYLYKKPATGWTSRSELTSFTVNNSANFGSSPNNPFDISADQNTIAIADQWYANAPLPQNYYGAIFVYHKLPGLEWSGSIIPKVVHAPEIDALDFGRGGVVLYEDRLFTSTPYTPTGNGRIYIYRDASGNFTNPVLEAKLTSGSSAESSWLGFKNFVVTADGIFASASVAINSTPEHDIIFFQKPFSGNWIDATRSCSLSPVVQGESAKVYLTLSTNGQDIYVSGNNTAGKGFFNVLKKHPTGWCNTLAQTVDSFSPSPQQLMGNYGAVNACSQTNNLAVGYVPHPDNPSAQIALKIFSPDGSNGWDSQLLYPLRKSTAGHYFGESILGFEDYLFVGAPRDNTVRSGGGAVYTYKKTGTSWQKTGKILAPVRDKYDDVFASALATDGTYLAVGASGFEDHGKVFMYKKKNSDWSSVELVQEIELPSDILTVYASGDNLAMNKDWLLIPYVQNSPARVMLAIYKFNGTTWDFSQSLEVAFANFFAKSTSLAVDIEDKTIVLAGRIIEQNESGQWEVRHLLSPSDPEDMRIAPDFSHWVSNGSMFGFQIDISNNSIFISAPTKDHEGVWDVGAIYVYTKKPWEPWSSMTETAKILPRIKAENEIFGYSMKVLGNTMIVGAPGADYNKDGVTPRNKPGRAYVYQSPDYFCREAAPHIDLTGDSFVKDYFGIAVNLDETDFFIGASIEDIDNAKLSGSVYITPTPPIVKLVPPVCSTNETIDLFGYPFGGTWSGPGIIDAAKGIFDPEVAGLGEHEFTYKTASCTYTGQLKINVEGPAEAKIEGSPEHLVCENTQYINIPLKIQSKPNYRYAWFYREKPEQEFLQLAGNTNANMNATKRGEYKVRMDNTVCESFSDIITIRNEKLDLALQPVEKICMDPPAGVTLTATPAGGRWSGQGVNTNKLYTTGLSNGTYTLTYHYTSPLGCTYQNNMMVQVDRMVPPNLQRISGNLCVEGGVVLKASPTTLPSTQYEWQWKSIGQSTFTSLTANTNEITVTDRGTYQVTVRNGDCYANSTSLIVSDNAFEAKMSPEESDLKLCFGNSSDLSIADAPGRTYEWFYMETPESSPEQLRSTGNSYTVEKSGFYFAKIHSGACSAESPVKSVVVFPEDQIFIPNVFTPNGDGFNDEFKIESNQDDVQFRVMNRYGQQVFSGRSPTVWTGDNASSGVYFWLVLYHTCTGDYKEEKGSVHLVR